MRGRREEELISRSLAETGLGSTIRAWRRYRGLSVTDLAVQAGFGTNGRGYISRVEHGQIRHLGEERLERIATVLQLPGADLLLHRMPEVREEASTRDLDDAIIGGKALLKECGEQSFDWARIQLLLAKLYRERAATSPLIVIRYTALVDARQCIACALLVFTEDTAPKSVEEAMQLDQEIAAALNVSVITGSMALLKRCLPQSLDWARVQLLRARMYRDQASVLEGSVARTALTEAQHCIEAALPIFTRRQARRSLKEARQLNQEIQMAIQQFDG